MEIIRAKNLKFTYENSDEPVLNNINLTVKKGEFAILYGPSGCGKTTLLRLMKKEMNPEGRLKGGVMYKGTNIKRLDKFKSASEIGYVMQNPDSQIVTDKVWHELAFGLETLGYSSDVIRRRTAEISSFFGINSWYRNDTSKLSGGQKQLLNLAAAMAMSPELILLDEPVSQLDPFSARAFINMLERLNRELGITVIMAEHDLEHVFAIADVIAVMEKGTISYTGLPETCGAFLNDNEKILKGLPPYVQLHSAMKLKTPCPMDIREAILFIHGNFKNEIDEIETVPEKRAVEKAIELKNVRFRYEKEGPDILRDVNMNVNKGEIYGVVGGNGSGKTTLLSIISDENTPFSGKVLIEGKKKINIGSIAVLPQNPISLFTEETLEEDLDKYAKSLGMENNWANERVLLACKEMGILDLMKRHPYDLSGGECQKAAIAKILMKNPKIILLDEPTKGIDAWYKQKLIEILKSLKNSGKTIVIVTHDNEFAAEATDRCGLLFDGEIISENRSREFFSTNEFYTTAARRMTRGFYKNAVTCKDVIELCSRNGGAIND